MVRKPELWLKCIKLHVNDGVPMTKLAEQYNLDLSKLKYKVKVYLLHGESPFEIKKTYIFANSDRINIHIFANSDVIFIHIFAIFILKNSFIMYYMPEDIHYVQKKNLPRIIEMEKRIKW